MKFAALILQIGENTPYLAMVLDKNDKMKIFTNERQAESYIQKNYSKDCVFYGLIPDPTNAYKKLKKAYSKL